MAGAGSRFQAMGYQLPKPLIDVLGRPMIKVVVDSLGIDANFTFLTRAEHIKSYAVPTVLDLIQPKSTLISVPALTSGAASTVMLAQDRIDNSLPLLIANADQDVRWKYAEFMQVINDRHADAGILTFPASDPKWSYAREENGYVVEVAEKRPISDKATVGIYYWRKGSDFVRCARQMIAKNIRVNNEFYVCPVFNEAIALGLKVVTHDVVSMEGLGTPEDLCAYAERRNV